MNLKWIYYYHYDFLEKCEKIFNVDKIDIRKFEGNRTHAILKIRNKK